VNSDLQKIRDEIDRLDSQLVLIINRRMELAVEVGRIKAVAGLPTFHPEREQQVAKRLSEINPGPLGDESLRAIYREIFAASRLMQYRLQVAFPGPEWTTSHLASISLFGHSASYLPCTSMEEVFDSFLKGKAHLAVIPIEATLQGWGGHGIDLLYTHQVLVVSECYLEIAHYLCAGVDKDSVKHLYARTEAFSQCRGWLAENLGRVECTECSSTARAAMLAKEDPFGAAICNLYAAERYGLGVLAERIEDVAGITARFLALGHHVNSPTGNDKTSLLFSVSDKPGALFAALSALSMTNMSRIESRPNKLFPGQYLFFADIDGHREDPVIVCALEALGKTVSFVKVLGSYPKGDPGKPFRIEKENMRSPLEGQVGR
jgi:chorismate mutase/prephenate dehydratase